MGYRLDDKIYGVLFWNLHKFPNICCKYVPTIQGVFELHGNDIYHKMRLCLKFLKFCAVKPETLTRP